MELELAVRTRRTHKAFAPEPVSRETIEALVDVARWAPNHHLTNPWRFAVLGARTRLALELVADAVKPGSAVKLRRAPTLIVLSRVRADDPLQDREDLLATAMAGYVLLLAAHARGLAGYWRTLSLLDTPEGSAAIESPESEDPIALLYLGHPLQDQRVTPREPVAKVVRYLP